MLLRSTFVAFFLSSSCFALSLRDRLLDSLNSLDLPADPGMKVPFILDNTRASGLGNLMDNDPVAKFHTLVKAEPPSARMGAVNGAYGDENDMDVQYQLLAGSLPMAGDIDEGFGQERLQGLEAETNAMLQDQREIRAEIDTLEQLISHGDKILEAMPVKRKRLKELKAKLTDEEIVLSERGSLEKLKRQEKILAELDEELNGANKRIAQLRELREKVEDSIAKLKDEIENAGKKTSNNEDEDESASEEDEGESEEDEGESEEDEGESEEDEGESEEDEGESEDEAASEDGDADENAEDEDAEDENAEE